MALSTMMIAFILLLVVGIGLAGFNFLTAMRYKSSLTTFANARGANVIGKNKTVNLSCDPGKVICVYRATEVCSNPGFGGKNFENPQTDPISDGSGGGVYGAFSKTTTRSLTKEISALVNGKNKAQYTFSGNNVSCGGEPQLIMSYTCMQPGMACTSAPE